MDNRRSFLKNSMYTTAVTSFAHSIIPVSNSAFAAESSIDDLHRDIYRQYHIDAHFARCKEVYKDFDAEKAAQMIADAGFQMVTYFAVCHQGYSYYPTKIGTVHPGMDRDFTGEFTAALKKRGILCFVYLKVGWDRKYHKINPDWIYNKDYERTTVPNKAIREDAEICLNTPWVEQVQIPQMKELLEFYDIDGFFIDIVMQKYLHDNCYCLYCRQSYEQTVGGKIPLNDDDPNAFRYRKWSNKMMETYMEKVYQGVAEAKQGITIINNYSWLTRYPVQPPEHVKQINWDTPPPRIGVYGLNMSVEARYLSTLGQISWSCHNTRGNTWGDYSIRDINAYMHETAVLLAGCGRSFLSDDAYPSGNPDQAVLKLYGKVNDRTRSLEPFIKGCEPVKEVAVLHSADSVWSKSPLIPSPSWNSGPAYYSVNGAHKALIETHIQMNILNSYKLVETLDDYRVLILPDQRILSEAECESIKNFVRNGGVLIASGRTGIRDTMNTQLPNFSLAEVFGVDFIGMQPNNRCYLRATSDLDKYDIIHRLNNVHAILSGAKHWNSEIGGWCD